MRFTSINFKRLLLTKTGFFLYIVSGQVSAGATIYVPYTNINGTTVIASTAIVTSTYGANIGISVTQLQQFGAGIPITANTNSVRVTLPNQNIGSILQYSILSQNNSAVMYSTGLSGIVTVGIGNLISSDAAGAFPTVFSQPTVPNNFTVKNYGTITNTTGTYAVASNGGMDTTLYNGSTVNHDVAMGQGSVDMQGSAVVNGSVSTVIFSGSTGALNLTMAGGNISGSVTSQGPASIALNGSGNIGGAVSTAANSTITLASTGGIIGALTGGANTTLTFSGSGNVGGAVTTGANSTINFNSTGKVNGTITGTAPSTIQVGNTYQTNAAISGYSTVQISNGATFTKTQNMTGLTTVTVGTNAIFNNNSSTTGITTLTNPATVNVNQDLSATGVTNSRAIAIATGKSFTIAAGGTASIFNPGSSITGLGTFINNGTATYAANALQADTDMGVSFFTNTGTFNFNKSMSINSTITNTGTFNIASGLSLTFTGQTTYNDGAVMSGVGAFVNTGTLNFNSTTTSATGLGFTGLFTNSGTLNVQQNLTRANSMSNTGTVAVSVGKTFTTTGSLDLSGTGLISGAGAYTNQGTLTYTGTNGASALSFTGLFTNSSLLNVNADLTRAYAFTNTGTIAIAAGKTFTISGAMSGGGTITNNGNIVLSNSFTSVGGSLSLPAGSNLYINSGGNFTMPTGTFTNNGNTHVNGTGIITGAFTGGANSTLSIGDTSSAAFTTSGAFSGVEIINVYNGSSLTSANTFSLVKGFNVFSGGSATFTAALTGAGNTSTYNVVNSGTMNMNSGSTLSGFSSYNISAGATTSFTGSSISNIGSFNNSGTLTFAPAGVTTFSNTIPYIYMFGNAIMNVNEDLTLDNTSVAYNQGSYPYPPNNTALNIASGKTLSLTNNSSIVNIKTTTISGPTGKLQLNSGSTVSTSGASSLIINGTLEILNGATFSISPGDNISGSGSITNNGTMSLNGCDLTLGGSFNNQAGGVFSIYGTPTLTFGGSFNNDGLILSTFNQNNNLPQINIQTTPTMANGTIGVGYSGNYIASGDYTFITAATPLTLADVGAAALPQPNMYIRAWSINANGGTINVGVDRSGFGAAATDPNAIIIGNYMEQIGANNPNASQLAILNALEQITSVSELNSALLDLAPPEYVPLQTLSLLQNSQLLVQGRLYQARQVYAAGDELKDNGVWIRPTGGAARQDVKDNLAGYNASFNGLIGGMDQQLHPKYKIGAAISAYHSTVNDNVNTTSVTRINSYQAMVYGSYKSDTHEILDWIINGGVNNYHGVRGIVVGDALAATANSHYTGQQFSVKAIASKQFVVGKYYQLTPLATAQYSFLRQLSYTETGAGSFNLYVQPDNVNLFELGLGAQFSVPFDQGKVTSIPEVHGLLLVDAQGGAVQATSQFLSGGPLLTNTVQPGRLALQLGASLTFAVSDNIQMIANYDFEWRQSYKSHMVYLNLRYIF